MTQRLLFDPHSLLMRSDVVPKELRWLACTTILTADGSIVISDVCMMLAIPILHQADAK